MRKAVCLLLVQNGKILACSRGDDHTAWGLPGGKVEDGESEAEAIIREVEEETGLNLTEPSFVYAASTDGEFMTYTCIGKVSGDIRDSNEGIVRWVEPNVLTDKPFGSYNKALFSKVGISYDQDSIT